MHLYQFADGHDRPDNGRKVADKLQQLPCVEYAPIYQISAVSQDNADNRTDEQGNGSIKPGRQAGIGYVDLLILLIQLSETAEFLGLLNKGFDNSDA